jgi:hypothetical protein
MRTSAPTLGLRCVQEATYAALQQLAREHPDMAGVAQAKMELMQTTRKAVCTQQELHDAWAAFETFFKAMDQVKLWGGRAACMRACMQRSGRATSTCP